MPVFQAYSLVSRGSPGLTCDLDGLTLGPVALAIRVPDANGGQRYKLLPLERMVEVLRLAYGPIPDSVMQRRCRGLFRATQLLQLGSDALARIHAVLIGFPEITPDAMTKLAAVASLRKYNPDWEDEARTPAGESDGGEWTSDGDDGGDTDIDTDVANLAMSPECEEEWAAARKFCTDLDDRDLLGKFGYRGFGSTYEQCLRGQVSAACGGNPVG